MERVRVRHGHVVLGAGAVEQALGESDLAEQALVEPELVEQALVGPELV